MNDQQVELLHEINDSMSNKYSDYFVFYSKSSSFNVVFPTPIKLNPNRNYKIGLQYFTTSNYLINITEANNKFYYSTDTGKTWTTLTIEKGAYELKQLSDEINRLMAEKKHYDNSNPTHPKYYFNIGVNLSTFKSYIDITNPTYEIDFTKDNTFRGLLGFNSKKLKAGYNKSDDTVQIINTSAILIKSDLVSGGYVNGVKQGILYSFPSMLVPVGYKINITAANIFYLPINRKEITSIYFEITNQHGEIIDLKGEEVCLAVVLKQV
jgi:hypothetical protein